MAIYSLNPEILQFPPPVLTGRQGILAIGGKIDVDWLLEAYSIGVFPWYNDDEPVMWWCPDPRSVAKPGEVKISKSMKRYFTNGIFQLKIDTAFEEVINACRYIPRSNQDGTWINDKIVDTFIELHRMGYAHSFETWENGKLVGGLYGISLGKMFFGESMFSKVSNASKFAFISLSEILKANSFMLIDCQVPNSHLISMGCKNIPRLKFLEYIEINRNFNTLKGNWSEKLILPDKIF